jgi:acyl-CoA synthetase (AMP-forming)/AMP-acid ligase II
VGKKRRKPARPASVMSGYYADQAATGKAFAGGWFHSGDLTVWHPDVIIELRDRGKDIIISGRASSGRCPRPPPARCKGSC